MLTHANLFNGKQNRIYTNSTVYIKDRKIFHIDTISAPIRPGYEIIDVTGNYLVPGLIDAHTHLDNIAAAKRALETGVTTVRTAGVPAFQDVAIANLVTGGILAGPDIIPGGAVSYTHLF